MNNLLVMKFGGTSMGSAERIRVAASICTEEKVQRPVLAVVSAMSGVTDLLLGALRHAEADDEAGIESSIQSLSDRHEKTCHELLREPVRCDRAMAGIRELIADFHRIAHGMLMLGDRPPRSVDEAIAIGERLSALMIAEYLEASGTPARAINARDVIVTDAVFGNATPIMEATRRKAATLIEPLLADGVLPVVTGFNGATVDGRPTTLGRGGSDFSASILAAALDASELWIWTDVDGIMSADPRSVPEARVLDALTYNEAAELAYNGAKVLHPRTLAPLIERQIPVWSKNSFHLDHPGTRIVSTVEAAAGPRAVTSMANVALVSIEPASAAVSGTRLMARALDALADANAEVLALSSSSYRQSFCFLVRKEELAAVMKSLEADLAMELTHGYLKPISVDDNVGLLALVGEGMRGTPGLAGRLFQAISAQNVNIIAIAQGSSELTISIVVRRDGLERAIQAVHRECR
jgi:aspartokinase/homoserine dehydrogenase 1